MPQLRKRKLFGNNIIKQHNLEQDQNIIWDDYEAQVTKRKSKKNEDGILQNEIKKEGGLKMFKLKKDKEIRGMNGNDGNILIQKRAGSAPDLDTIIFKIPQKKPKRQSDKYHQLQLLILEDQQQQWLQHH
ncbi:MAG: hypothetical protein EZS28_037252 [Streblomastix strix]|uniref:Uncharacterized protein n=1 Tax=Streblomastix strix TaxID=222440 RepID=A0A5J4UBH1_9EUKA|nr:MAG: hypothetical protein EZS28_037252 [Streblomastix strix]